MIRLHRSALLVALSATLGGCASAHHRYGAFASELDARSLARSFGCDASTFPAEHEHNADVAVDVGQPFCLVLARFGDPTYSGMTDALQSGVVRVHYPVKGRVYRATAHRDKGETPSWTVTASGFTRR